MCEVILGQLSRFLNGKIPLNNSEKDAGLYPALPSDQAGALNEKIKLYT